MEQIKRANKLFTNDCMFLKETLSIPVLPDSPSLGGLSAGPPETAAAADSSFCPAEEPAIAGGDLPASSPPEPDFPPAQPAEVSARDFLQRLDLQIKLSTQAAQKLKEDGRDEESPYAASLYHS
ncbi:lysM and putative peptidoglycan-binding domain-containing protein 2 [Ctenodactylus gundi]